MREIFDAFDTMNDGVIDVQEFWELCVGIGREITRDQAKEALSKLDLNSDGVVDFDEFFTWWVPFEQRMQEKIKVRGLSSMPCRCTSAAVALCAFRSLS